MGINVKKTAKSGNSDKKIRKVLGIIITAVLAVVICVVSIVFLFTSHMEDRTEKEMFSYEKLGRKITNTRIHYPNKAGIVFDAHKIMDDDYIYISLSTKDIYKVEFINKNKSDYIIINTMPYAEEEIKNFLQLVPKHIVDKGYTKIKVCPLGGNGDYEVYEVETLKDPNFENYTDAVIVDFEIKKMEIEIDEDDYDKLWDKRAEALALGLLFTDDDDYVPVDIFVEGKKYKADMRLKGDEIEHLSTEKWSYRVKVDNECIWGMEKISLHRPQSRANIGEYLVHEFYKEQGGIGLKYDFADVVVNGVYKGVYAVEQAFDKRVVEGSLRREGAIIKFNENLQWERAIYSPLAFFDGAKIQPFSENKSYKNPILSDYVQYSTELLYSFLHTESDLKLDDVFDLTMFAKYYASLDCLGSLHGNIWHNMRMYYNPITARLEPIAFDVMLGWKPTRMIYSSGDPFTSRFLEDESFSKLYFEELKKTSSKVDEFLLNQEDRIREFNFILARDEIAPFSYDIVNEKLGRIESFQENRGVYSKLSNRLEEEGEEITITIGNNNVLPITVKELYSGIRNVEIEERIISAEGTITIGYEEDIDTSDLSVVYTLPNFEETFISNVNVIETSFFVAGHAYGYYDKSESEIPFMHKPFREKIESIRDDELIDFGVFTGDFVIAANRELYENFIDDTERMDKTIYAVPGNHDVGDGGVLFEEFMGEEYRAFVENNNLFILLAPGKDWSINSEQIEFINNRLANNMHVDNIFVLTHYLMWFEYDDERFDGIIPNGKTGKDGESNFWDEVLPLFGEYENDVYFVAGDVGAFANGSEIEYRRAADNRHFIASGMGGGVRDNYLVVDINSKGEVRFNIIALNGDDKNALGRIEDHMGDVR